VSTTREIRLDRRPVGRPEKDCFALTEITVTPPGPSEVEIRPVLLSVDPYMRGRMDDRPSYVPPFAVGSPIEGFGIGTVEAAGPDAGLAPGDVVTGMLRWRERDVLPARRLRRLERRGEPLEAHLGPLGMTGLTAYVGLTDVGGLRPGETVLVTGAAGAVGSVAGQIAKFAGCRVIGVAGGAQKVARLRELGCDQAVDYRAGDLPRALRRAAPDGVDLFFDNVGGDQLEAALSLMNVGGRVVLCGAIAQYNDEVPRPGPRNLALAIGRRLTLRGFIVGDYEARRPAFEAAMRRWLAEGRVQADSTVLEGFERLPEAFLGLFEGTNLGKMLVRVGPEPAGR
jgi:NADPH-dependent curcumin reductase CurA